MYFPTIEFIHVFVSDVALLYSEFHMHHPETLL